jgi:hypothetical protein
MAAKRKHADAGPVLIADVSDIHAGSTVALMPPTILLDDGQELHASKLQRWLWQCWGEYWEGVARLRDAHKARLVCLINGDILDGPNHHGTVQSVSSHPGIEKDIAVALLEVPKALGVEVWHVIRGTEAHSGKGNSGENAIAKWLGAVKDKETGQHSTFHLRMDVQGVRFDVAHHGRGGFMPWTEAAGAARYAMQVWTEYAMDGEPPPHFVLRGHLHRFHDTASLAPARLIQTPPWQLHTGFSHRIAASARKAQVGGAMILVRDGAAEVQPFVRRPQRSQPWSA